MNYENRFSLQVRGELSHDLFSLKGNQTVGNMWLTDVLPASTISWEILLIRFSYVPPRLDLLFCDWYTLEELGSGLCRDDLRTAVFDFTSASFDFICTRESVLGRSHTIETVIHILWLLSSVQLFMALQHLQILTSHFWAGPEPD